MRPLTITFLALLPLVVATASSQDERPNLLLITVDTLRADYLGVNGATEGQTPNLDSSCRLRGEPHAHPFFRTLDASFSRLDLHRGLSADAWRA